jgi:adenine deaminase
MTITNDLAVLARGTGGLILTTVQGQITGNAATAYSNATIFAANASTINTGSIGVAYLPANLVFWSNTNTFTANQTFSSNVSFSSTITTKLISANSSTQTQASPAISSNILTLDLSAASVFSVNLNSNITTLTLNNLQASGNTTSFVLNLTADGTARTFAWPAAFRWPSATAPTVTSALNKTDVIVAFTYDNGTNWFAFTSGQNL